MSVTCLLLKLSITVSLAARVNRLTSRAIAGTSCWAASTDWGSEPTQSCPAPAPSSSASVRLDSLPEEKILSREIWNAAATKGG